MKYPQNEAQVLLLTEIVSNEKEAIKLTIMTIVGKKYKKIAKGEVIINQRFVTGEKKSLQKWIDLTLFQRHFENMGHNPEIVKAEKFSGKIQMDISAIDTISIKKPASGKESKDAFKKQKSKKVEAPQDHFDDIEQEQRKEDLFNDGLSDHSISIIDEEDQKCIESIEGIRGEEISHLVEMFNANCGNILPKDIGLLKDLNQILYTQCKSLSEEYEKSLKSINASNEKIRVQANAYYEKYKESKRELYKERVAYRQKRMTLNEQIVSSEETYKKAFEEMNECKANLASFQSNLSNEGNQDNNASLSSSVQSQAEDINAMSEILKHVHNIGYNIFAGLNDEQKKQLKAIVNVEEHEEGKRFEEDDLRAMKEDIDLGNTIVGMIEKVANDLFPKNLIGNVKIDQINAITYVFDDDITQKEVTLRVSNNNTLLTETGENFVSWILKHFGRK